MKTAQELIDSTEAEFEAAGVEFSSIFPDAFVTIYTSETDWEPDELRKLADVLDVVRKEAAQ